MKYLALVALVVLVTLTACATPTPEPKAPVAQPTTAQPTEVKANTPANTLVINADISDMISLDPAVAYEFSGDLVVHQLYETLVKFEGADLATLKPGLATKWDIKETSTGYDLTFTLRDNAKFASGNPVTSADVVYSFQRVISLNKSPAFLFTDIAQMKSDNIKAPDAKTVVISIPKMASAQGLLAILTFTVGSVVDSKEVKAHEVGGDFGSAWLLDHSAGSGPYMLDHWKKETEVVLNTNPNASTKPLLSSVLIKHVPEAANQLVALQKGDTDLARNLSPEQIASLKGVPGVTTTTGNSLLLVYLGMNVAVKPLDHPKVREAIRTAIDYDGIVNGLLSGNAKNVQGIIPGGLAGFNPDRPFKQDIAAAKKLLSDGGVPDGFSIELLVPTGQAPGGVAWADLAQKIQADLAKINVKISIKQTTQAELLGTYRAQKGQMVLILWGPDFPDPDANVGPFTDYTAKSIAYRNSWDDKTIAQKARDAALLTDPAKRAAAYKEITDYVLHNGPYAILYQPNELFGLRSNIKGFTWSPIGWTDFWLFSK
jgi:peptide/nickel transport system substrate-binding protein